MKLKKTKIGLLTISSLVCLLGIARADIYCEREVTTNFQADTGGNVSKVTHERVYIRDKMLKIEEIETGKLTIVRLDDDMVLKTDPVAKTFNQSSLQAIKLALTQEKMASSKRKPQVGLGQEAVKKQLIQSMPVEQRSIMEEMMMSQMSKMRESMADKTESDESVGKAELNVTLDTKTILGYNTNRIKVVQPVGSKRKKITEMWLTTQIEPQNYLTDFVEALDIFNADVIEELKKAVGFPLQMKYRVQKGTLANNLQTVKVTKLQIRELPAMDFEVPSDYKPISTPSATQSTGEEEESF
jgi:hypothetical protein